MSQTPKRMSGPMNQTAHRNRCLTHAAPTKCMIDLHEAQLQHSYKIVKRNVYSIKHTRLKKVIIFKAPPTTFFWIDNQTVYYRKGQQCQWGHLTVNFEKLTYLQSSTMLVSITVFLGDDPHFSPARPSLTCRMLCEHLDSKVPCL